jgi:hypothetical protein
VTKRLTQVALAGVWIICLLSCNDKVETSYTSRLEADRSGAISHGWIPAMIPANATAIREYHDLDTNESFGTFRFPAGEGSLLKDALRETSSSALREIEVSAPRVNWWPASLRGRIDETKLASTGFKIHTLEQHGTMFFAVNWQSGEAFFWRTGPYRNPGGPGDK